MQRKFLYIKWFLVLLMIVQINGRTSNFQKIKYMGTSLGRAEEEMLENKELYEKEFTRVKEEYRQFVKILKNGNKKNFEFGNIKDSIRDIVNTIKESVKILLAAESSANNEPIPTTEDIIYNMLSIAACTAWFADIYYNFPEITTEILEVEIDWHNVLSKAVKFTHSMETILDSSTVALISVVKKHFHENKQELRFKIRKAPKRKIWTY
ncbi:hypothetical protein M0804_012957 [Polistes exclamans]|nr:hypothetical protein M0804_012957 [Polistes exclamans]